MSARSALRSALNLPPVPRVSPLPQKASKDPAKPGTDGSVSCFSMECKTRANTLVGCPIDTAAGQFFPNLHFLSKSVQQPALPAGCDKIKLLAVPKVSA